MTSTSPGSGPDRGDDRPARESEVLRERYRELLEELRTIMPGVQVLFAFLLIAPFSNRFQELDPFGVRAFAVALVTAALATIIFLTPAAYHRLDHQQHRRERLVTSVRMQLTGMALLAFATADAVFVVVRFLFDTPIGAVAGGLVVAAVLALWLALPWAQADRSPPD